MFVNSVLSENGIEPEIFRDKTNQKATYFAALKLVVCIDEDLTRGLHHYRDRTGHLLTTLDEVVHAVLASSLPEEG